MAPNMKSVSGGDRRSKPRIYVPFPATVQGLDENGQAFEVNTVIDSLSGDSLYLRLMMRVEQGARLSIVIQLSTSTTEGVATPRMSVHGEVLRSEERPGGACGVAVRFKSHRFI